jgi:hypothetical protein
VTAVGRFVRWTIKNARNPAVAGAEALVAIATLLSAAKIIYEYRSEIASYISTVWSGFVTLFHDQPNGISILSIVSGAGLVLATYFQRRYARAMRMLRAERREVGAYVEKVRAFEASNDDFLSIAQTNAECDKQLFDVFHNKLMLSEPPQVPLTEAMYFVDDNLAKTIDRAVSLFTNHSGNLCAVCIKIVDDSHSDGGNVSIGDLRVKTFRRDQRSDYLRHAHNDREDFIRNNTADHYIFTGVDGAFRNSIYAEDDLLTAARTGRYHNLRPGWQEDYTATLVCGIRNLGTGVRLPWSGLFCVDNKGGGLDNDLAKHYISELSCRISVMLYRQRTLRKWQAEAPRSDYRG